MTNQAQEAQTESKRRQAANQLGGHGDAQIYLDTEQENPVVLRKKDGWDRPTEHNHLNKTWLIQDPRCYIADADCDLDVITHATKLDRVRSGRYDVMDDATVEQVLETAKEKNWQWMKVHSPHIPYDGAGGINVYVGDERLNHKKIESEEQVFIRDGWPEYDLGVRVNYSSEEKHLEVEIEGDVVPYERVSDPEDIHDLLLFQPEGDHDGPDVELRLDQECEEPHDTDYDIDNGGIEDGV